MVIFQELQEVVRKGRAGGGGVSLTSVDALW